jgi:ribosomal protein S18 acetylase RimI-like enzyme
MLPGVSTTGGSEMHVRTARPSDYLDALTVDDRADQWTRVLTDELDPPREVFVAADDDGRIVGFIAVGGEMDVADATRGEVYALNVHPDRWGHGVGRALLTAGCGHLRAVGFATAVLWVHPDNTRACRVYHAAGWRADGTERRHDALGVEVPAIRYHHSLIGEPA